MQQAAGGKLRHQIAEMHSELVAMVFDGRALRVIERPATLELPPDLVFHLAQFEDLIGPSDLDVVAETIGPPVYARGDDDILTRPDQAAVAVLFLTSAVLLL